ncbi:hypothetical protein K431DRAFT_299732 [Polychaeton citri CBS 116435]|uniref:Uncharacterized protein n=1 Tax=Polychaeton citri CBS 116435 TaxID=1314669 RepID=A0A9P4QJF8_9PEZI|nr:hypothetical protein K431DRAFT_299732 [Polychaeton citri CBS 116435]
MSTAEDRVRTWLENGTLLPLTLNPEVSLLSANLVARSPNLDMEYLEQIIYEELHGLVKRNPTWNLVMAAVVKDVQEKLLKTISSNQGCLESIVLATRAIHVESYQPSEIEIAVVEKVLSLFTQGFRLDQKGATTKTSAAYVKAIVNSISKVRNDMLNNNTTSKSAPSALAYSVVFEQDDTSPGAGRNAPKDELTSSGAPVSRDIQRIPRIRPNNSKGGVENAPQNTESRIPDDSTPKRVVLKEEDDDKSNAYNTGQPQRIRTHFGRGNYSHREGTAWEPKELLSAMEAIRDAYAVNKSKLLPSTKKALVTVHNNRFTGQKNSKGKQCGNRSWESLRQQKPKLTENVGRTIDEAITSLKDLVERGETLMGPEMCLAKKKRKSMAPKGTKRKTLEEDAATIENAYKEEQAKKSRIWKGAIKDNSDQGDILLTK